jgi:outer membrane autotransporter protein
VVPPGAFLVQTWTAAYPSVNDYLIKWNSATPSTLPFATSQPVYEVYPTQALNYVRLYAPGSSSALGSWMMSAHDVRGLTAAQLRDLFALPVLPTNIVQVRIPAGSQYGLWTGIAGPIAGWGDGGGQQTKVIGYHADPIGPADPADFASYTYLPANNYVNGQALGATALSYTRMVQTGNATTMAAYLNTINPNDGTDLANVYTALDYLNYGTDPGPLTAALRQISPEKFDAISAVGLRDDILFAEALMGRLTAPEGRGRGVWAQGVGDFGSQTQTADHVGFDEHGAGLVAGFDWRLEPGILLGAAAGGIQNRIDWAGDGGDAYLDEARFGLYAGLSGSAAFLNAALVGGWNQTNAWRNIDFTGRGYSVSTGQDTVDLAIDRTATSLQNGQSLAAHCEGGTKVDLWGWEASPVARLSYFDLHQNAFDEGSADSLDLHVDGFTAQTFRSELRLLLGRGFPRKMGFLRPQLELGWAHDEPLDTRPISARLVDQGDATATFHGNDEPTDRLLAGGGLSVEGPGGLSFNGSYRAELGTGFHEQTARLGLRYGF